MTAIRVLGCPGSGKTSHLLGEVEWAIGEGCAPDRIGFVSFSRAAVRVASDRAAERFGVEARRLTWFRTIHSIAYRLLGVRRSQIVTERRLTEFAKANGYRFTHQQWDEDPDAYERAARGVLQDGDQLLSFYDWQRHTCQPDIATAMRRRNRVGQDALGSEALIRRFSDRYEDWKREHEYIDFTDLLTECAAAGLTPPLDVLIVDEAQDLTPLEAGLVARWMGRTALSYLAGDPDQAVYQWAGADGRWLREFTADRDVALTDSHRCARAVQRLAARVISRCHTRVPYQWTPRAAEGAVTRDADLARLPLDDGRAWFVLARNHYLLPRLSQTLTERGIPFVNRSGVSAFDEPAELAGVVTGLQLADGERVDIGAALHLYRRIIPRRTGAGELWTADGPKALARLGEEYTDAYVDLTMLPGATPLLTTLLRDPARRWETFGKVRSRARLAAMRGVYQAHGLAGLTTTPRVTLSTIHAAKGLEADAVALCPDLSRRTRRGEEADPDAESRVWYVASTRAKDDVHVLAPRGRTVYAL